MSSRYLRVALWIIPALLVIITLTLPMFSLFQENTLVPLIYTSVHDSLFVALWIVTAWGFGAWLSRWTWPTSLPATVQCAIGAGILMWLDHVLGALGWLQSLHAAGAWALVFLGIVGALLALRDRDSAGPEHAGIRWPSAGIVSASLTIGLLIIAAASAPGWLWSSEYGGFDVLEYHLQLPKEWIDLGRITPVTHLVYSCLPNYVEGAFYHLALLAVPFTPETSHPAWEIATAAQLLSACFTFLSACVTVHVARQMLRFALGPESRSLNLAPLAGVVILALPWTVVVGTMAYDEMAVILLFVAAVYLAIDAFARQHTSITQWVIIGLVLGLCVGAKLTAVGAAVLPLCILLTWATWQLRSLKAVCIMSVTSAMGVMVALLPYLVRNWFALRAVTPGSHNVFFPLFTNILGIQHWTAEQAQRWNAAHHVQLAPADQFTRLWHEAFLHPQWMGLWFVGIAAIVLLLILGARRARIVALACAVALIVQVLFWMIFTHLQSRFLWTSMVPLALAAATALTTWHARTRWPMARRAISTLAWCAGLWLFGTSFVIYTLQQHGRPSTYIAGVERRSTSRWNELGDPLKKFLLENFSDVYLTVAIDPGDDVYLLGDSTPFYILHPVIWNTTWDTAPLGDVIRTLPDDPALWHLALREEGIRYVLVNQSELHRLIDVDRWYDPDVTMQRIATLLQNATPVKSWYLNEKTTGRTLYRLNEK